MTPNNDTPYKPMWVIFIHTAMDAKRETMKILRPHRLSQGHTQSDVRPPLGSISEGFHLLPIASHPGNRTFPTWGFTVLSQAILRTSISTYSRVWAVSPVNSMLISAWGTSSELKLAPTFNGSMFPQEKNFFPYISLLCHFPLPFSKASKIFLWPVLYGLESFGALDYIRTFI